MCGCGSGGMGGGGGGGGGAGGGAGVGGGAGGGQSIPQTSVDYLVADLAALRADITGLQTQTQYVPISDGNLPDPEIIFESDEGDIVFIEVPLP